MIEDPNVGILLIGVVGSLLPDLLRIYNQKGDLSEYKTSQRYVGLAVQILLGILAVYMLIIIQKPELSFKSHGVEALAYGFAAPEFLTRAIGIFLSPKQDPAPVPKGFQEPSIKKSLPEWWTN